MNVLYDTNILIDQLRGRQQAIDELKASIDPHISIVTWIEVLAGALSTNEETKIGRLLANFTVLPLTESIAERAAILRRDRRSLKLPDAIILATAQIKAGPSSPAIPATFPPPTQVSTSPKHSKQPRKPLPPYHPPHPQHP